MNRKNYLKIFALIICLILTTTAMVIAEPVDVSIIEDDFELGEFTKWDGYTLSTGESAIVHQDAAYNGLYGAWFTTDGDGGFEGAYTYQLDFDSSEMIVNAQINVVQSGISFRTLCANSSTAVNQSSTVFCSKR